jgi:tetratricopeptide (TPR) repeat protein
MSDLRSRLLIAIVLGAILVSRASGQQPDHRPQLPPAAVTLPTLPADLTGELARAEQTIDQAINHPEDLDSIQTAIPAAQHVLDVRTARQGAGWWETVDARCRLDDLRLLTRLPADERRSLAEVWRLGDGVDELHQAAKDEEAVARLRAIADTEKRILGEDHRLYAVTLHWIALIYRSRGRNAEAAPVYRQAIEIDKKALGEEHPVVAALLHRLASVYQTMNQYELAEPLYRQALDIRRRVVGEQHADYIASLTDLGRLYELMHRYEQAEPLYRQALDIRKRTVGERHPEYAASLSDLAFLYELARRYEEADSLYRQALDIRKAAQGEHHAEYVRTLENLADTDKLMFRYQQAEALYRRVLELRGTTPGEEPSARARTLESLAETCRLAGRFSEAEPLYRQVLVVLKDASGDKTAAYARALDDLGQLYTRMGRYTEAEPLCRQAAEIRKATLGDRDPNYGRNLEELAAVYTFMARYAEAEPLYRQAADIVKQAWGEEDLSYAACLSNLAMLYYYAGRYSEAEPLYRRAIEIGRGAIGKGHREAYPNYLNALSSLAMLYVSAGRYKEADALFDEAVDVERRTLGDAHPDYAKTLFNRALLYAGTGRYADAEPLFLRALDIDRKALGDGHPEYANDLRGLAVVYQSMGRAADAERMFLEANEIVKKALGDQHPQYATGLYALATLYHSTGRRDLAEPLYRQAMEIEKKTVGDQHPDLGCTLNNLALLYQSTGRYAEAEPLLRQAMEIDKRALGAQHPMYAKGLINLAVLYVNSGRPRDAEPFLREAVAIQQKILALDDPDYATGLHNLAYVLAQTHRADEASAVFLESARVEWKHMTRNFPSMSSEQKKQFLAHMNAGDKAGQSEMLWSLLFQANGRDATAGLQVAMLTKQLLFETARQESASLAESVATAPAEWQANWRKREQLRRQYATLALQSMTDAGGLQKPGRTPTDPRSVRALADEIERLEQQLRRDSPVYASQARLQQMTVDDVRPVLRAGEVLIEYVGYKPFAFDTRQWGKARYGAFVLQGGSGHVAAINLGDAEAVDAAVQRFRQAVQESIDEFKTVEPGRGKVRRSEAQIAAASLEVRRLVWQPLEKALAGIKRVYIAPDGLLSLIPFDALARADGAGGWRYLAEDRELVYLGTSRDLGRLALTGRTTRAQPRTAVLVSNPNFNADARTLAAVVADVKPATPASVGTGMTDASPSPATTGTLGGAVSAAPCQLPASWDQGAVIELDRLLTGPARQQLTRLHWSVTTLSGDRGVEEAVLGVQAPRLLQFATHGFYLNCSPASQGWDNPLLRSGMVLAGANTWPKAHAVYYRVGTEVLSEAQARTRGLSDDQLQADRVAVASGILTAYDVTGMNLEGTELVNLTACETGLGDVTPDGVAGLRQAFLLAGARALTMSMWEVPAEETGKEVSDFYDRWLGSGGQGRKPQRRYEAFHAAQLEALARARQTRGGGHPSYWAGTIFVGDPGDLPTVPVAPAVAGGR